MSNLFDSCLQSYLLFLRHIATGTVISIWRYFFAHNHRSKNVIFLYYSTAYNKSCLNKALDQLLLFDNKCENVYLTSAQNFTFKTADQEKFARTKEISRARELYSFVLLAISDNSYAKHRAIFTTQVDRCPAITNQPNHENAGGFRTRPVFFRFPAACRCGPSILRFKKNLPLGRWHKKTRGTVEKNRGAVVTLQATVDTRERAWILTGFIVASGKAQVFGFGARQSPKIQ